MDWKKKIKILGRQISIKKLLFLFIVGLVLYIIVFNLRMPKEFGGEFIKTEFFPKSNSCGNDAILYFKDNNGVYHYLIVNEYNTGILVELDYHVGEQVTVRYGNSLLGDIHSLWSYEVD